MDPNPVYFLAVHLWIQIQSCYPILCLAKVVDLQKYWVFESDVHGTKDAVLKECCSVLVKAIQTIHDKAEVRLTIIGGLILYIFE